LQRLERIVRSVIFFCLETKGKYWNVKFKSEEINLSMKKDYGGDFKSPGSQTTTRLEKRIVRSVGIIIILAWKQKGRGKQAWNVKLCNGIYWTNKTSFWTRKVGEFQLADL
jgi:hypothetical protein